jgi:hypothetical protein
LKASISGGIVFSDSVDMAVVVVRQFAGSHEAHRHLQEAEAHQARGPSGMAL